MKKTNCWDHTGCGRQPGGAKAEEFGVCPVATDLAAEKSGVNNGEFGGRCCWDLIKMLHCQNCEFRRIVEDEERRNKHQP